MLSTATRNIANEISSYHAVIAPGGAYVIAIAIRCFADCDSGSPSKTDADSEPHIERVSAKVWGGDVVVKNWPRRGRLIDVFDANHPYHTITPHRRADALDVGLRIISRLRRAWYVMIPHMISGRTSTITLQ